MLNRRQKGVTHVLVAGASGQLARSLAALSKNEAGGCVVTALGRPELDIVDENSIDAALDRIKPDILVNAVAYTAVDRAETEEALAYAVNRDGTGALARATATRGLPIIHVSTDYVFNGTKSEPYTETDTPNPQGVYGRSKYEGELAIADANPQHLILRTAWVYSEYGNNFLKTMLRLASEKPELRVVADQHGNPTYAGDLAAGIIAMIAALPSLSPGQSPWGIYHLAGQGETSWHGLAQHIIDCAAKHGRTPIPVMPISTADYPTPAKRPANSRLDCSKATAVFGVTLPHWRDSVERCVTKLISSQT